MIMKKGFIKNLAAVGVLAILMTASAALSSAAVSAATKTIDAGASWVVSETMNLDGLTISEGAVIKAPEGYSLTMTVDGVETGMNPGTYKGRIVITRAEANIVNYEKAKLTHYYRQALYLDDNGVVQTKSVLPAAGIYMAKDGVLTGVKIVSRGECFNGIYAAGGSHTVQGAVIDFTGNGGNDFAGYGAAVMATGEKTTLVVDGAKINTSGAVRTAVVAGGGSNLIIKNSEIKTKNGVLPADYVPNVSLGIMKEAPWMLGIVGNCRATNLVGNNTIASYINSSISAEGWGVLSTDDGKNVKLTAINSKIIISGSSGYGAYGIGGAIDGFYGCDITVPDYAAIITGGNAIFGASTPETVSQLNTDMKMGLTKSELSSLKQNRTTVKSGRFGVMWHGNGSAKVMDDTVFDCEKTIFLVKGSSATIKVDGSKGARLNTKNGVVLQVMDNDDPGPVNVDGVMVNKGVYHEPAEAPARAKDFDVTAANDTDVKAAFSNIVLKGDFYNSFTGVKKSGNMAGAVSPSSSAGSPAGGAPAAGAAAGAAPAGGGSRSSASGKNLNLSFESAVITGVISASSAKHTKDTITGADYALLGEVANTPSEAVNNGMIVSMINSTWTVTGTSYLTNLTLDNSSAIKAKEGYIVTLTVNGVKKAIGPGVYKGNVMITATKI
jgi:hypothetical protein